MNDNAGSACSGADVQLGLSAADDARHKGDLDEALRLWAETSRRHPDNLMATLKPAIALREAGRGAEAEALLTDAISRFPDELEPMWVYSLLAQERGERTEAARRFTMLLDRFPSHRDSYLRVIGLLRDLGRFAEAEERLGVAMQRFPAEPWFAAQYGWTALARNDIEIALARFQVCIERFPDYSDAVLGAAVTLRGRGAMQQADDLLAGGILRFPGDSGIAFGYADHGLWMRTAGLLSWDETLQRWDRLRATFPDFQRGYIESIRVLADAGRLDAAEELAATAVERFPSDIGLAAEFAKRAEDRQDWPELIRRFKLMAARFPDHSSGHAGLGRALSLAGRHDEADALLSAAVARFPRDPDPVIEYALVANRRGDWPAAAVRWADAQQRFPDHRNISHNLGEARLRLVDLQDPVAQEPGTLAGLEGAAAIAATATTVLDRAAMHQIVMQFVSLGGDSERGGCEFGLFQREYGAEPLDLLRWSTMRHFELIPALDAAFEGVGEPENTELVLGPPQENPEYFTVDKRFGMRMHTFVRGAEVPFDTMFKQVCRRLRFLRGKLLSDLRSADKIFVYNSYPNDLNDEQIDRLFAAIRRHGDTTLLYVRSASDIHPEATVIERAPGLLIGHIDSPSKSGRTAIGAQPWPAWAKICPEALVRWKKRHEASPAR